MSLSIGKRTFIAFAAVYLVWGSTYLAIRFTIETLPPLLTAGVRFLLAGIILSVFSYIKEGAMQVSREHWKSAFIIGGLLLLGGNGSVVWAEHFVPSGLAALVIAVTPLWMVLLQWLWQKGKRPSAGVLAGIAIGFMGVGILIAPDLRTHVYQVHIGGTLALLLASLSWAVGSVYSRRVAVPKSPFLATGMQMICGGLLLVLAGLVQGEISLVHPASFSFKSIMAFIYLIFAGSLIGFTAYIWLLKNVGITKASTYAFVNPIVAVILGCLLAGEQLNMHIGLAACLIVAAVIIITLYHREEIC